jgi:hypothetical protein
MYQARLAFAGYNWPRCRLRAAHGTGLRKDTEGDQCAIHVDEKESLEQL